MTKRIISVLLALVLVLALAMPAMAADLKINGFEGQTYHLWKLFDVVSMDGDAVSYQVTDAWRTFFSDGNPGAEYVSLDGNGLVTWVKPAETKDTDVKALAAAALSYATADGTKIDPVQTVTMDAPAEGEDVAATFKTVTGMDMGYYLLDSNVGSLLALTTTQAEISDKNSVPTHVKKIVENDQRVERNEVNIGDTINYEVTIDVKANLHSLKLTDTMDDTITFNNDVAVKYGTETLVKGTDYTVTETTITADGDTYFEVIFTDAFLARATDANDIVVTYSGVLNANAKIHEANNNDTTIKYGNKYNVESVPSHVDTWTFDINVKKVDGSDNKVLAGVEFELRKSNEENAPALKFGAAVDTTKEDGTKVREYTLAAGEVTTLVTNEAGTFTVNGVDEGTYYLVETKTLDGYNKLDAPIVVKVAKNGDVTMETESGFVAADPVVITNNKGMELPETGGIGTTIFYLVGGLMMAAAVVLLVAKKRTVNE